METGMKSGTHYKIVYKFTLRPDVWDEFLAHQRKAHAIYSNYVKYDLDFLRSEVDPNEILEIQTFASHEDAKKIENLHEKEPDLAGLFQKFLSLLDANKPGIDTIVGETTRI